MGNMGRTSVGVLVMLTETFYLKDALMYVQSVRTILFTNTDKVTGARFYIPTPVFTCINTADNNHMVGFTQAQIEDLL